MHGLHLGALEIITSNPHGHNSRERRNYSYFTEGGRKLGTDSGWHWSNVLERSQIGHSVSFLTSRIHLYYMVPSSSLEEWHLPSVCSRETYKIRILPFFFLNVALGSCYFFSPVAIKSWKEIYLNTVEENRSMLAPWTHTHMWPHVSFSEVLQSPVFLSAHHLIKEEILFAMWKVNPVDVAFVHYLAVTFVDSKIIGFHALENVSGRGSLLKYFPGHSRIVGLEIIPLNCGL